MQKHWKRALVFVALILILILCSLMQMYRHGDIERKIIAAVDQRLKGEGECDIDLAVLFREFDWNTVSIFVGGNSAQIQNALKIENDISDGIVFSLDGQPIKFAMSTYQFPEDVPPNISYYIERENDTDPYYISLAHENAIVHVEKYIFQHHGYKYLLYCR